MRPPPPRAVSAETGRPGASAGGTSAASESTAARASIGPSRRPDRTIARDRAANRTATRSCMSRTGGAASHASSDAPPRQDRDRPEKAQPAGARKLAPERQRADLADPVAQLGPLRRRQRHDMAVGIVGHDPNPTHGDAGETRHRIFGVRSNAALKTF